MVRQANTNDIPLIENIFYDVVFWMKEKRLKQWRFKDLDWAKLSFSVNDFYICFDKKNNAVGFVILSSYDTNNVWNKWHLSSCLYIYKLAVKREYSKLGYSSELLNFSKVFAQENGYINLCLYCQSKRSKLKKLYEQNSFSYIGEQKIKKEIDPSSFYVYQIEKNLM